MAKALRVSTGEMKVAKGGDKTMEAHGLSSGIAITIYDPEVEVGGIFVSTLPESKINPSRAQENPLLFADTGLPQFLKGAFELGAEQPRLEAKLIGGADLLSESEFFNIGRRNYLSAREALAKAGVKIKAEMVGGTGARSIRLNLATGKVTVTTASGEEREL